MNKTLNKRAIACLIIMIIILFCLSAVAMISMYTNPPLFIWFKTLATLGCFVMALIAVLFIKGAPPVLKIGFSAALFFAAVSDFVIIKHFIIGLIIFLLVHIINTVSIFILAKRIEIKALIVVAVITTVIFLILLPYLKGSFIFYVAFYCLVIMFMVVSTLSAIKSTVLHSYQKQLIILAAVLFYISDLILAVDKFVNNIPYAAFFILVPYYSAQICFAASLYNIYKQEMTLSE